MLSWEEAQAREFDEAVMLNERGEIAAATMANIFWVREGTVYTPALSTGAVAGITRSTVLKLAEADSIPVVEGIYELSDLVEADEIFLTSANLGVAVVTTFDFRKYAVTAESIGARLRKAFRTLVQTQLDPRPQFLFPDQHHRRLFGRANLLKETSDRLVLIHGNAAGSLSQRAREN